MANYAMMAGNTVENIIVADDKEATEEALRCVLIEITQDIPAGIGYTFDEAKGVFIAPQPFASWVLDEETCRWAAPIDYPTDELIYEWDESVGNWIEAEQ